MAVVATACSGDGSSESTNSATLPRGVPDDARVATVVATVDADTLRVAFTDSTGSTAPSPEVEISMIGAVRPESDECLAAESDAFAQQELPAGTTVYLAADEQDAGPDGSLLRYVWDSDGEFYNDKLLRQGFATAAPVPPNQRFHNQLSAAEFEAMTARRGVWGCPNAPPPATTPPATTPPPTAPPATAPPATAPPATTPPLTAPPATAAPPTVPVPPGRTAALGEAFALDVGETVSVLGAGLSVTFTSVADDNRCRPGTQCIVAGNATVVVEVAKAGTPPASLALNTDEEPRSARYGNHSVELVQLSFGRPPTARLRVT